MSKNWRGGSTRRWREGVRPFVLARDGYLCQLQREGCTRIATHAHHTKGRSVTGDDPRYVVAACAQCNIAEGDPTANPDPSHTPSHRW